MGPTVSSMFAHVARHATPPSVGGSTALVALALLAAAALLMLVVRRRGRHEAEVGSPSRGAGGRFDLQGALGALGMGAMGQGAPMRVVSRLALGPGRYLCMVEVGERVFLVAVGGDMRLLGELEGVLPRTRRERLVAAERLLAEKAQDLSQAVPAQAASVVELAPRAAARGRTAAAGEDADPLADRSGRLFDAAERYRTTAAATAPHRGPKTASDDVLGDEDAAYFSQLLTASLERMQAAGDRFLERPMGRAGLGAVLAEDGALAEAWPMEDAGL